MLYNQAGDLVSGLGVAFKVCLLPALEQVARTKISTHVLQVAGEGYNAAWDGQENRSTSVISSFHLYVSELTSLGRCAYFAMRARDILRAAS